VARKMLPLVRSIVADIRQGQGQLAQLYPEQDQLERNRRQLTWRDRERRYQISEDIRQTETRVTNATLELDQLGLTLVDSQAGLVDFPARINGRSAAFSWQPDEPNIQFWHYQGETLRRPIPKEWEENKILA